jgi:hypothetical protein
MAKAKWRKRGQLKADTGDTGPPKPRGKRARQPRLSPARDPGVMPTPQRAARGQWADRPKGIEAPMVDMAHDMIGALHCAGRITYAQEQAARLFQEILAAYLAEYGLGGYRSCLAGDTRAFDAGDGNPDAWAAHDTLKRRLGAVRYAFLRTEVDKPNGAKPQDMDALRKALDAIT